MRNSTVAIAPANCELIAKTKLTKEPQKDSRCCGAPSLVNPSNKNGYIVIEVQYGLN